MKSFHRLVIYLKNFIQRITNYFQGLETDNFSGKVWLAIIEKGLIFVAATGIVLVFQSYAHHYQEIRDAKIASSKIFTNMLLNQRDLFIETMNKYFLLLGKLKSEWRISKEELNIIRGYRTNITFLIDTFRGIELRRKNKGEIENKGLALLDDVNLMYNLLLENEEEIPKQPFEDIMKKSRDNYILFLGYLRDMTMETVKTEITSAR